MSTTKKTLEPGCYFDSHRGRYIGVAVIKLAVEYGFNPTDCPPINDDLTNWEHYCELWTEAEEYLFNFCPDGFYFGHNESGDCGVWENEEDFWDMPEPN